MSRGGTSAWMKVSCARTIKERDFREDKCWGDETCSPSDEEIGLVVFLGIETLKHETIKTMLAMLDT